MLETTPELTRAEPPAAAGAPEGATVVPITGVGERLVARMNESLAVPTATSFREIDAGLLQAERSRLDAAIALRKLSCTHLFAFAIAQAPADPPDDGRFLPRGRKPAAARLFGRAPRRAGADRARGGRRMNVLFGASGSPVAR
jgi:hypothetical protein